MDMSQSPLIPSTRAHDRYGPCGGMMKACAQVPALAWNYYIAVESIAQSAVASMTR